jgi:hypothetical protein
LDETEAEAFALELGGTTWQSGGGIWLVIIERADGHVIALSHELVAEYRSQEKLEVGDAIRSIRLR